MAPTRRSLVFAVALGLGTLAVGACGEPPIEPSIPEIDLQPDIVLVVDDSGLRWESGLADIQGLSIDPTRIPRDTLLEIRNEGDEPHRVRADVRFDTGVLEPGEATLVLFDDRLTEPEEHTIEDVDEPSHSTTFEILPSDPD